MYTCIVVTGKLSFAWTNRSHRKIPTWVFGFSQDDLAIYHALFSRNFFTRKNPVYFTFYLFVCIQCVHCIHYTWFTYKSVLQSTLYYILIISYCYHAVEFFTRTFSIYWTSQGMGWVNLNYMMNIVV